MTKITIKIFQFHLVRLKAGGEGHYPVSRRISIPFSTIKRCGGVQQRGQGGISIPFSTIKSF